MLRSFSARQVLTVATLLIVALPPIQAGWACSFSIYDAASGPLGSGFVYTESDSRVLPSNALFLMTHGQTPELTFEDGTPVPLESTDGPTPPADSFLLAPTVQVAGLAVAFGSATLTFSLEPDTKAPTAPILESIVERELGDGDGGCMDRTTTSCDGVTRVSAELSNVRDDVATTAHLVFAIYRGDTAEEASQARVPVQWIISAEGEREVTLFGIHAARGSWVVVTAIDEAGNESERSAPERVR